MCLGNGGKCNAKEKDRILGGRECERTLLRITIEILHRACVVVGGGKEVSADASELRSIAAKSDEDDDQ